MANFGPFYWYVRDNAPTSTVGWSAVTAWATGASKSAGALVRQSATPTVGNERVFVCVVAGTTHASTEPTWVVTKGGKTTDNTVTWQECTGQPGVNGDLTNTPTWLQNKNKVVTLGLVVQRASAGSLQIITTAGSTGNGSEPSFSDTAGVTTSDNSVTWTSLGAPGNFSSWAAPHARLNNAMGAGNWAQPGDGVLVGDDHVETQSSSNTITSGGATGNPVSIYSIDHTLSLPVTGVTSGATVTTTGNSSITLRNNSQYDGVTFNVGTGANAPLITIGGGTDSLIKLSNCAIAKLATNNNNMNISGGSFGLRHEWINTTLKVGNTSDVFQVGPGAKLLWRNTASAIQGATLPTTLFSENSLGGQAEIVCEGVDLSALGSGKTLVSGGNAAGHFSFINCKFGASVTIASTPTSPANVTDVISSASGATTYKQNRVAYEGTLSDETTIIRTGGASDGTTGISWKIVTTANSTWSAPFDAYPISIWNATTGSNVTVTLYGIWGGGAVPNNDDIWFDVEYLGDSGSPRASRATSTKSSGLSTNSALSSDSSTWGGSTTKFKMSVTLSTPQPQLAGNLRIYVRAAKISTTFYIDPLPVLT